MVWLPKNTLSCEKHITPYSAHRQTNVILVNRLFVATLFMTH